MSQPQTIQSSLPSDPNVSYIDTVHAYDQWANVSNHLSACAIDSVLKENI